MSHAANASGAAEAKRDSRARRGPPDALAKGLRIAGHPVHPALTHAPIGFFVAALPADIIGLATGDAFFFRAAWWLLLGGLIVVVPTAVSGFVDWWMMQRGSKERRLATAHMVVNVIAVVVYLASLLLRGTAEGEPAKPMVWAIALNGVGFVLLLAGGTLGGTMIFKHRVGCDPTGVRPDEPREVAVPAPPPPESPDRQDAT